MSGFLEKVLSAFRRDVPYPTEAHRRIFGKACLRYLRAQGWRMVEEGQIGEYWGDFGGRRAIVFFYLDERPITELHIADWAAHKTQIRLPFYVFSQARPHPAFIELAAERDVVLRSYVDISILDITDDNRAAEAAMLEEERKLKAARPR